LKHRYEGRVEGNIYLLMTDGARENVLPFQPGFEWGGGQATPFTYNTATRILAREVQVPKIGAYVELFAERVLTRLPTDRPWELTSDDILSWMATL
jgi:hypothetical protein